MLRFRYRALHGNLGIDLKKEKGTYPQTIGAYLISAHIMRA
jgi:hypothetical protein